MTMNRMLRTVLMVTLSMAVAVGMWSVMPAQRVAAAECKWGGVMLDGLWENSGNWMDCNGGIPTASDTVVLDNSNYGGSYVVTLPTGSVTVAITKLTITPASGNTITLLLPSGNTANPGLNVGDNTSGTDDVILNAGAILKNSSGASSGTGVAVYGTSNGTFRINNGGRYIHNTIRGNSGIVSRLSTAAGTETGIFEFDVPTTSATYVVSAANYTYGTLMLSRSAGTSFRYTITGGTPLTIRGDLVVNSNAVFDAGAFTGAISVAGNWNVHTDAASVVPSTIIPTVAGTLTNNGTLTQTRTVNNATVSFLTISTDKYRGVDITTTNDLGAVTVAIQGNADACTDDPASALYIKRCFSIEPTNNAAATLTLWATDGELNGIDNADLALYRFVAGWVKQVTNFSVGTGTNSYNYVTADVDGFSSFLIGDTNNAPTAVALSGLSATSPFAVLAVGLLAAAGLVVLRKRK